MIILRQPEDRFIKSKIIDSVTEKCKVVNRVMNPYLTYSSESWTQMKKQLRRLNSMEIKFLRKIEGKIYINGQYID